MNGGYSGAPATSQQSYASYYAAPQQPQQSPVQVAQMNPQRFSNPNVESNNPHVFMAVYSGVAVFEMMCRGIGVMRRRSDNYMNATQLLKVAGIDKGKRTRILEKDIINTGAYEKVQGGYGRFQGTWIPFERAKELADQYGIGQLLSPIFDYGNTGTGLPNGMNNDALYTSNGVQGRTTADKRPAGSTSHSTANGTQIDSDSSRKRERETEIELQDGKRIRLDGNSIQYAQPTQQTVSRLQEATKPSKATGSIVDDPMKTDRHKQIIHSIFVTEHPPQAIIDLSTIFPSDLDPDTPIDDHLHTALHWAASLARMPLIRPLLASGADINRGNDVGETALVRAVLTTNHFDFDTFGPLLEALSASLRTIDSLGRTVLHHIALIAGVKGRTDSARYYMESVLEWIARKEDGDFHDLVNAQDKNGDTALNIAARVGSKGLAKMLIEVGADASRANKLGLKPSDFGLDKTSMADGHRQEVIAALKASNNSAIGSVTKSQDILSSLLNLVQSLGADFDKEMVTKNEAIKRAQTQLQTASHDLTEQRQQLAHWKGRVSELDYLQQSIKHLTRALAEENAFDWTGRTELSGQPSQDPAFNPAFSSQEPLSFQVGDPQIPTTNKPEDLVRLRRMHLWYSRILDLVRQRSERTKGSSTELEGRYRRVVAYFCGVPVDNVDGMLEQLLQAIESDGAALDVGRVASFLNKVKTTT